MYKRHRFPIATQFVYEPSGQHALQNLKNWLAPGGYFQLTAFVWQSRLERLTPTFTPKLHTARIVRLFNWLELVETKQLSASEFGQAKMFCYLFRATE